MVKHVLDKLLIYFVYTYIDYIEKELFVFLTAWFIL